MTHFLQRSSTSKMLLISPKTSPTRHQMFKHMNLWELFISKSQGPGSEALMSEVLTSPRLSLLLKVHSWASSQTRLFFFGSVLWLYFLPGCFPMVPGSSMCCSWTCDSLVPSLNSLSPSWIITAIFYLHPSSRNNDSESYHLWINA